MKAFAPRTLAFVGWFPLAILLVGCPSQSEGQRCDQRNGSADCASGLQCIQVTGGAQLCCVPVASGPSSAPECNLGAIEDAAPSLDVTTESDGEVDATSEAPATDAAPEAPADTASESEASFADASSESTPDSDSATTDATDAAAQ
jgi:hypothetical protein